MNTRLHLRLGCLVLLTFFLLLGAANSRAAVGDITTVIGNGVGDGDQAANALLNTPGGMAIDYAGNLYIADTYHHRVRKVGLDGVITTIAGTGFAGFSGDGGDGEAAQLNLPYDLALDASGNLYIADYGNHRIRKLSSNGVINTLTGTGVGGFAGDGGQAVSAQINAPTALALDASGNLFIADTDNHRIRKIAVDGSISTVAGSGTAGFSGDGGAATVAQLSSPAGVAVDAAGVVYIADTGNRRLRKLSSGNISTLAGTGVAGDSGDGGAVASAQLNTPRGLAIDDFGRLYVVDSTAQRLRYIDGSGIYAMAGDGTQGFAGDGGDKLAAQFDNPLAAVVHTSGDVYIADSDNHRIRRLLQGSNIETVVGMGAASFGGDGAAASLAKLDTPSSITIDSQGNRYLADRYNHRIRKVAIDGGITTIAGTGVAGFAGDGGAATAAQLNEPTGVAVDSQDNLYIADSANQRVRMIDVAGTISSVAGNGVAGYAGDGGSALSAQLQNPIDIALDAQDNLYIADYGNHRLRKVTAGTISTIAGTGSAGFSGDGGVATAAQLNGVRGLVFDDAGSLYLADELNERVRKIDSLGNISTVAGTGVAGFGGDGGLATAAQLSAPADLAIDAEGNLFVADSGNHRLRRIDTAGNITTFAGSGTQGYDGDGDAASAARLNTPLAVAVDADRHVLIAGANQVVRRVEANLAPSDIQFLSVPVYENSDTSGSPEVGSLVALDPNVGDSHVYSISGGADQAAFFIDGIFLKLQAGVSLDYETQSSYSVEVTATDAGGLPVSKTLTVNLTDRDDPMQGALAVSGVMVEHETLSVDTSGLHEPDGFGEFSYQWLRNGRTITGANAADYVLELNDVDHQISVRLSYVDGVGTEVETSAVAGWPAGDLDADGLIDELDDDIDGDGMPNSFESVNMLDARNAADALSDPDGDGRNNLDEYIAKGDPRADDVPPLIQVSDNIVVDATGLVTEVDIGVGTAVDALDGEVLLISSINDPLFLPGAHVVEWIATDNAGNRARVEQSIHVVPMVDFAPDQLAVEGGTVTVAMLLNGPAPVYPVTVPFQVAGSAGQEQDHDLVAGQFVFADGETRAELSFEVLADGLADAGETITLSMGEPVNAVLGVRDQHQVTVLEGNIAPSVTLSVEQAGRVGRVLTQDGGEVHITAVVRDANSADVHRYDWSLTDNNLVDLDAAVDRFTFDPQALATGDYLLHVSVSDGELSSDYRLPLQLLATAPTLRLADSDGDGVRDTDEGFGDADADGVPDYLDAVSQANVLQSQEAVSDQYLVESEPGLQLRLGELAMATGVAQAGISQNDVVDHAAGQSADSEYYFDGGLYDFNVEALPSAGASVSVVLPQLRQIPAGAVYRKLGPAGWAAFYEDDNNRLASAAGERGYCPPPNDAAYTSGLTAGHWCVQLTIQDGGPNDADGLANHRVEDPGGVAQPRVVQSQVAPAPVSGSSSGGGALGWLMLSGLVLLARGRRLSTGKLKARRA